MDVAEPQQEVQQEQDVELLEPEDVVESVIMTVDGDNHERAEADDDVQICEPSPAKLRKIDTSLDDEDGSTCLICYYPFTNSGEHRLSCLACGHIFGKSCIIKWLKTSSSCPQCNDKARKKDVRILYTKHLRALDTAERDRALQELESVKYSKQHAELEIAKLRLLSQTKDAELNKLRDDVKKYQCQVQQLEHYIQNSTPASSSSPMKAGTIDVLKTISMSKFSTGAGSSSSSSSSSKAPELLFKSCRSLMWKGEECRVAAYSEWSNAFVVSHKFNNVLNNSLSKAFGGYGIRIFNWADMKKAICKLPLHQKEIRDMAFNPNQTDLLLTVGMDSKAQLTNVHSTLQVLSFTTESPLWSCAFNVADPNIFYVGMANGQIMTYDIRNTREALSNFNFPSTDKSPVCRLHFVPSTYQQRTFNASGLLVQKLNSCWFVEFRGPDDVKYHQLPLEGGFFSLDFEPVSRHLLISVRPSAPKNPTCRHMVCQMTHTPSYDGTNAYSCDVVKYFQGASVVSKLNRPKMFSPVDDKVYVAASKSNSQVSMWDLSEFELKQSFRASDIVLDYVPVRHNDSYFLNFLTTDGLETYKYHV